MHSGIGGEGTHFQYIMDVHAMYLDTHPPPTRNKQEKKNRKKKKKEEKKLLTNP